MLTTSVTFSAFGCFYILKTDLAVYKPDRECFRRGKCYCGSYTVYFLELKALKYSRSELELLPEDISYQKQQSVRRNSDLLREYGIYVKIWVSFIHCAATLAATGVKNVEGDK